MAASSENSKLFAAMALASTRWHRQQPLALASPENAATKSLARKHGISGGWRALGFANKNGNWLWRGVAINRSVISKMWRLMKSIGGQ
jgi:hypothetical protein